jgi:hypothetical protein
MILLTARRSASCERFASRPLMEPLEALPMQAPSQAHWQAYTGDKRTNLFYNRGEYWEWTT